MKSPPLYDYCRSTPMLFMMATIRAAHLNFHAARRHFTIIFDFAPPPAFLAARQMMATRRRHAAAGRLMAHFEPFRRYVADALCAPSFKRMADRRSRMPSRFPASHAIEAIGCRALAAADAISTPRLAFLKNSPPLEVYSPSRRMMPHTIVYFHAIFTPSIRLYAMRHFIYHHLLLFFIICRANAYIYSLPPASRCFRQCL